MEFKGNYLKLSDRPGLGADLNMDHIMSDLHPAWKEQMAPEPRRTKKRSR